jgi:predicted Zn finger-like uncharacterized protein
LYGMANEISCPKCQTVYRLKGDLPPNKMLKCKKCGSTFPSKSVAVTQAYTPPASEFPLATDTAERTGQGLAGKIIGGCRLEKKLGEGGMGIVYRAHHIALDIKVAVKILPPHFVSIDKTFSSRFIREARSAAQLHHQNIVGVINVGEEDGLHFIVMQYVDGEDIYSRINRDGRIPVEETISIAIQMAQALVVAAKSNIVHRDIKPDNIMIDSEGIVKLADLGLAKNIEEQTHVTRSGVGLGTPLYMAPEQAENARDVDHRCDFYALGCTLFHMLSGNPPYSGTSSIAIMVKHMNEPVPRICDCAQGVPPRFGALLQHMMAKDPAERPQTAVELLRELQDIKRSLNKPLISDSDVQRIGAANAQAGMPKGVMFAIGGIIATVFLVIIVLAISLSGGNNDAPRRPNDRDLAQRNPPIDIPAEKEPEPKPTETEVTPPEKQPDTEPADTKVAPTKKEPEPTVTVVTPPKVTPDPPIVKVTPPKKEPEPEPKVIEKGMIDIKNWRTAAALRAKWTTPEKAKWAEADFTNGILSLSNTTGKARAYLKQTTQRVFGEFTVRLEVRNIITVGLVQSSKAKYTAYKTVDTAEDEGSTNWHVIELTQRRGHYSISVDGDEITNSTIRSIANAPRGNLILAIAPNVRAAIRSCKIECKEPPDAPTRRPGGSRPRPPRGRKPPPRR